MSHGSGWSVQEINIIVLHVAAFTPTSASSYIPTPKYIVGKHAIISVQNEDNKYFIWSILAALHPQVQHPYCVSKYKMYKRELNVTGLLFPLAVTNMKKFEQVNPYQLMFSRTTARYAFIFMYLTIKQVTSYKFAVNICWWQASLHLHQRHEQPSSPTGPI